jgi:hypothetical protein
MCLTSNPSIVLPPPGEKFGLAAGVPGKLYCIELYLYVALMQLNTKEGLVMTRAGEKILIAASITVVYSLLLPRLSGGMKGSQIPGGTIFRASLAVLICTPVSRPVKAAGEAMLLRHSGRTSVLQPTQTLYIIARIPAARGWISQARYLYGMLVPGPGFSIPMFWCGSE